MNDELMRKAKALVDSVGADTNGSGLVSDATTRACDDLRLAMAKAVVTDLSWAKNFLEAAAVWHEQQPKDEDRAVWAGATNAANFRRIKEML